MAFFIDSTLCLMDNGNVSVLGVCLGNTATEVIDILNNLGLNYTRDHNCIKVEGYTFSKEFPNCNFTFILDSNRLVISFYISSTPMNQGVAEKSLWLFRDFTINNNLKRSKEISIEDTNNEVAVENGLFTIEIHKKEVPILKTLGRDNRYTINIIVHSRISIYHIPEDVKRAALRSSVSAVLINKKNDVRPYIKTCIILILIIAVIIISISSDFLKKCSHKDPENTFMKYSTAVEETDDNYVVYICTGETSKKYHWIEDCQWLQNCGSKIIPVTMEQAEQYGRTPCRGCCE